jgi:hypothetical protein
MSDDQSREDLVKQWHHARINRLIRRHKVASEWISFRDVADLCARELPAIAPIEEVRARAYDELADALIKGEFDDGGRPRVLFLYPGCRKVRMGWEGLADAIEFDWEGDRGHGRLAHCWAPRAMMERYFENRRLPKSPALFSRPPGGKERAMRQRAPEKVRSAPPQKLGKNERKRQAVDATIRELGVDAFIDMTQKARRQAVEQRAGPQLSGFTVSDRYVSGRLTVAKAERLESS